MSTLTRGFLLQVAKDAQAALQSFESHLTHVGTPWELALHRLRHAAEEAASLLPEPNPLDEDRKLVQRLVGLDSGLSEWEVRFVESLSRWAENSCLTRAQRERAEQIDERFA